MYNLLYADATGRIFQDPELMALGRSGSEVVLLEDEDMVKLDPGANLMYLPLRHPLGWNPDTNEVEVLIEAATETAAEELEESKNGSISTGQGSNRLPQAQLERHRSPHLQPKGKGQLCGPAYAVAAILPAGYTRLLLPAYEGPAASDASTDDAGILPLFGYTAVAARDGELYAAATVTDSIYRYKWDPLNYNHPRLSEWVKARKREFPRNRIVQQLGKCALEYRCFTAQNFFCGRWETGIPVSPTCNAGCLGCISLQPAECCPSPQSRIDFVPTTREIVEVAITHLEQAPDAIVSGGQGCEGEPLERAELWARAIKEIRKFTRRGTINLNTNAGNTEGLQAVCRAGLDSIRVSAISARPTVYNMYHQPRGYSLRDVERSIKIAKNAGVYVSLNLLAFPGLTDREEEIEAWVSFIEQLGIDMVQIRNLNIDPDFLCQRLQPPRGKILGMRRLLTCLAETGVRIGSFSYPVAETKGRF